MGDLARAGRSRGRLVHPATAAASSADDITVDLNFIPALLDSAHWTVSSTARFHCGRQMCPAP
jgi:hypothetical protein